MGLPELSERLLRLLGRDRSASLTSEVAEITPRALSASELDWVRSMCKVSKGWESTDLSRTRVVAEGPNAQGISLFLDAPAPENRLARECGYSVANLWLETVERLTINVQLSQHQGQLQELYTLIVDPKNPRMVLRSLPNGLQELSREAVGFSR